MINDNTILSSFNDRPTLLEWLKKVEEALKSDTATGVSVENPSVNSYIFKITFADGKTIASDTIQFPDSVKGASILNNHLILTMQSGITDDLGVINPYAETINNNSVTNTTEISNNAVIDGNLQVNGNVLFGNSIISIQGTTKQNGILGTNADGKIAFKEISGGTQLYKHKIDFKNFTSITLITLRQDAFKDGGWPNDNQLGFLVDSYGPSRPDATTSFNVIFGNASSISIKYINSSNQVATYTLNKSDIASEVVTAL